MDVLHDRSSIIAVEEDRISNLPNDIIHRILSFIDMRYAIQTSALSKKWKHIWTLMPNLKLNSLTSRTLPLFAKFVNDALSHRNHRTEVSAVELSFRGAATQFDAVVTSIVNYAYSHNVRKLTIAWFRPNYEVLKFPQRLFSSHTLKHLTLATHYMSGTGLSVPKSAWDFPALETLNLSNLRFSEGGVKSLNLFSKCVNLKDLILHTCDMLGVDIFNVCVPQLSNLTITNTFRFPKVFNVVAPQLESLTASVRDTCTNFLQLSVEDLDSLEKVNLSMQSPAWEKERYASGLLDLFQKLCGAKFLILDNGIIEVLSACLDQLLYQPCPFNNLKCLKQKDHTPIMSVKVRNYLLESSPSATFIIDLPQVPQKRSREEVDMGTMANKALSSCTNQLLYNASPFNNLKCLNQPDRIPRMPIQVKNKLLESSPSATFIMDLPQTRTQQPPADSGSRSTAAGRRRLRQQVTQTPAAGGMERQCGDSNTITPNDSNPTMNESISQSQPIGSSPAINSVTQNETQTNDDNEVESEGRKRKSRSIVWNHFKKIKVDGNDKAECNYCKKKLGGNSKNGTRHLHDHFNSCAKRPVRDIRQHILVGEQTKVDGTSSYVSNYTFNADKSRKNLAEMIIIHEYPLSMVEHHGFRKFVGGLQPLFKVPSRNTIKGDILKIYDFERQKTLKLLEKNTSRVAITTDMWTASNQKKGFMVLTAHFIDQNWNMQSRIMRFIYVPCPHTSENLADVLYECLLDWNLDRKLSTLTVDNCTTNDAIINILLDKLPLSSLIMGGSLFHMRCCAHVLNLIVQDGLNVIGDGIERIRDSVAFWTASPKRDQKFEEAARQLEVSCTKKLALDCKTRWNSTYLMISGAIIYKDVFQRLKQREPQYKSLPTERDWEFAKEICDRLQLFYEVTVMFSGSKYPTANVFFPHICEIRYSLVDWSCSTNEVIKEMAKKMLLKFDKYWSIIHGVMGMAAVLDPRYKLKFVELLFLVLYGQDRSSIEIEKLKNLVYTLFQEYECSDPGVRNNNGGVSGSSSLSSGTSASHRVEFQNLLSNIASIANQHDDSGLTTELDNYLKEKLLPKDIELDLLLWWKTNGYKYPTLQRIARDILAVPISTVASESAFSTGGRLVTPHRSRLHPKTLEALMCAQSWLLNEIRETCSGETEAYCRTIEYDYDVEEESKENGSLG